MLRKLISNVENVTIKRLEDERILSQMMALPHRSACKIVPNIAVIGSGGGIRAVIGMSAVMTVLQENNILDYTMYTAGLSGSSWYLLTLYSNDEFDTDTVNNNIIQNLHNFDGRKRGLLLKLVKYFKNSIWTGYGNNATFTNVFGEMVARLLLNEEEKCKTKWSGRTNILEEGLVPLPLIAALHVRDQKTRFEHNEWIEFSPYQVYIPRYGAAINMTHFGKSFYGGFCTDRYDEKPIAFLIGMCGSAYTIVRDCRPSGKEEYMSWRFIKKGIWFSYKLFDRLFVAKVPNILRGIPGFLNVLDLREKNQMCFASLLQMFVKFGRTAGQYIVDLVDVNSETMMLIDAGIAFNSPYPTILRPSRNVDLILSFDFTQRGKDSPFEELIKAEKWAKNKKMKFPIIRDTVELIEKARGEEEYEEMYIFRGDGTPIIMHFVMVNKSFRNIDDFDIFPAYETQRFNYNKEDINKLQRLVQYNVRENLLKINHLIRREMVKKAMQHHRFIRREIGKRQRQFHHYIPRRIVEKQIQNPNGEEEIINQREIKMLTWK